MNKLITITLMILALNLFATRKAMIVGVQNYDAFAPLESCHGDVDDMKELLMQGGFEDDHIWALKDAAYGETLTASKLFSNVNAFARGINEGDEVIFFFSGHGIGGSDGNNYLMGSDGNIENPEKYGSISVEEIKKIIKEKKPAEAVLIIDACRSFVKKEDKGIGNQVSSNMNIGKGIKVQPVIQTGNAINHEGKTIVKTIYAASEGQQSFERKDKNNGAFTYYMTYLLDSPNSAMDIDGSKDGIITIEDLIIFADNRINDWTKSQGLTPMNPVYQTEGGITYEPFMLFRYNAEKVVEEQKKEGSKPIFQYDEKAELEKIKKFTENKEYLKEELPVYQPKVVKDKKIEVDNTDLSSWKLAMAQEEEIKKAKAEEDRKAAEAKDKEKIYNELKSKYNSVIADLDKTEDIFIKHGKLEALRNEVNATKYTEVKQKILPLLEPVYQKINESKGQKQAELEALKPQFEIDLAEMEKMVGSDLSNDFKEKYLSEFKNKWNEYATLQKDSDLALRYSNVFLLKEIKTKTASITLVLVKTQDQNNEIIKRNDFYIGKHEITQNQYLEVTGNNPSTFQGKDKPVESLCYYDAIEFCNKLSIAEGLEKCYSGTSEKLIFNPSSNGYRLLTSLEWTFAAKGGSLSKNFDYSGSNNIDSVAWYSKNSINSSTQEVGMKKSNELGIFDMTGNVWEWIWTEKPRIEKKATKITKGGSWGTDEVSCKVNNSYSRDPLSKFDNLGFRIARNAKK